MVARRRMSSGRGGSGARGQVWLCGARLFFFWTGSRGGERFPCRARHAPHGWVGRWAPERAAHVGRGAHLPAGGHGCLGEWPMRDVHVAMVDACPRVCGTGLAENKFCVVLRRMMLLTGNRRENIVLAHGEMLGVFLRADMRLIFY